VHLTLTYVAMTMISTRPFPRVYCIVEWKWSNRWGDTVKYTSLPGLSQYRACDPTCVHSSVLSPPRPHGDLSRLPYAVRAGHLWHTWLPKHLNICHQSQLKLCHRQSQKDNGNRHVQTKKIELWRGLNFPGSWIANTSMTVCFFKWISL